MACRTLLLLVLVFFGVPALWGGEEWSGTSDVKFHGSSTLHDFDGTVTRIPLRVTVEPGPNGRVVNATSAVEVKRMSTADEKRDANMWTMFQQGKFPLLKVEVKDASEQTLHPPGGRPGSMPVTLTIAGQRGTITAVVKNVVESPTAGSFDLSFPISLKAFHLEPPKAAGGLIQVRDTVEVQVHVTLKKEAAQ